MITKETPETTSTFHPAFFYWPISRLFTDLEKDCGIESIWEPGISAEQSQERFCAYIAKIRPAGEKLEQRIWDWVELIQNDWLMRYVERETKAWATGPPKPLPSTPSFSGGINIPSLGDGNAKHS